MRPDGTWTALLGAHGALLVALCCGTPASAGCALPYQDDGRVIAVLDSRTVRLDDGRDIRLIGLAAMPTPDTATAMQAALNARLLNRNVTLHGGSDSPDRYGRQPVWVTVKDAGQSTQALMVAAGEAIADAVLPDSGCAAVLLAAEATARRDRLGLWTNGSVIKNAESFGDISDAVGHFMVVEGQVRSVRQAGSVTYVNFGRRWTRDFTVTISKRALAAFETAGMTPKSFENQRLRVRGYVERRGGPRIEALRPGQIEIVAANGMAGGTGGK